MPGVITRQAYTKTFMMKHISIFIIHNGSRVRVSIGFAARLTERERERERGGNLVSYIQFIEVSITSILTSMD